MSQRGNKHHILPLTYLKQFSRKENGLSDIGLVYALRKNWNACKVVHPKSIAFKRGYYANLVEPQLGEDVIEGLFSKFEQEYSRVVRNVLVSQKSLSYEDQQAISYFTALMMSRTENARASIDSRVLHLLNQTAYDLLLKGVSEERLSAIENTEVREALSELLSNMTREKAREYLKNNQLQITSNIFHLLLISKSLKLAGPMMLEKGWTILFDSEGSFITSDNPVCFAPMQRSDPFPYSPVNPRVIVSLPLTKHHLLLCAKLRTSNEVHYHPASSVLVGYANYLQLIQWNEWLISPHSLSIPR